MRVSINKSHEPYIEAIASQMGATPQQAINWLLWKLRENNYNFGGHLPQTPHTPTFTPRSPQAIKQFEQTQLQAEIDPSTFEQATAMSGLSFQPQSPRAIQEFEQLAEEIDPVIEKFISLGLVDQF